MGNTIFWHDYETFGSDPRRDRAAQFAGIRTDETLNEIDEPVQLYCQPAPDMLPHPEACLVTGITPQQALEWGEPEVDFIRRIHAEMIKPGTCTAGYNSIRFDDELTRQLLYRNFHDPYEREWKHGNSRWDIIDMLRLCHALRPQGIEWPQRDDGVASFRLEALTAANHINHADAHDALADVRATIAMAALVKAQQPKLYDWVYALRRKQAVSAQIDLKSRKPFLHVSASWGAQHAAIAPVMPLCLHPRDSNGVIVCDLRQDPEVWLQLPAEQIRQGLFVRREQLPVGSERIGLQVLHVNRCPVIAPLATLDAGRAPALAIDLDRCRQHWARINNSEDLVPRLQEVYSQAPTASATELQDPDLMLYSGGFFGDQDRKLMQQVRRSLPEELASLAAGFEDTRLPEMLFRFRARNYPQTLDSGEQQRWLAFCRQRLQRDDIKAGAGLPLVEFHQQLQHLAGTCDGGPQAEVIQALQDYATALMPALQDRGRG